MNSTLELLNIATYCTICHLRPLRNKYSFELLFNNYVLVIKTGFSMNVLSQVSDCILKELEKHLNVEHEFNYKLVEYTHYAIAWYNNSFDKNHGRSRDYCLAESERWTELAIKTYMGLKQ